MLRPLFLVFALAIMAGCTPEDGVFSNLGAYSEPYVIHSAENGPEGAEPGTCWGRHIAPAVVETVSEQVLVQPPEVLSDGTVQQPAIYKTETHQRITRERDETWFEAPCQKVLTAEFVASLQRALKVRGIYRGPISGAMDAVTRDAIRRYQKPQGLDTGVLSMQAARDLGLVAVPRDPE
ncbi:Putative peptidoglycan binding domain-containing protein [Salinihabitans flavidus]|uniref:Putative peptidoglycan binding domain-containing protein n=1 Tax=Salinihabitans flavidus TaxID=569882 RepID=A0A1H8SMG3_9RHOB|nr:peptidoglycan-binding domain-containing protein [Salinihabitans flavidus]SEO79393.1 Putative peptidoglycan binding domain-containing protein [Salinihabitans flavidus]